MLSPPADIVGRHLALPWSNLTSEAKLTDSHRPLTEEQIRAAHVEEVNPLSGRILLVDYDPRWADLFEREAARIRAALAKEALRIEHVGSTSVPGLPAKPIVDVVFVVTDSADEGAYLPALVSTGYRLHVRESHWHEHRMFKGPDTDVNLHTFSAGCPGITECCCSEIGSGPTPRTASCRLERNQPWLKRNGGSCRITPMPRVQSSMTSLPGTSKIGPDKHHCEGRLPGRASLATGPSSAMT